MHKSHQHSLKYAQVEGTSLGERITITGEKASSDDRESGDEA